MTEAPNGGTAAPSVAIVGGGFTGAAVAYHLARALPPGAAEIVVVEPRAALGAGLAYSTREPAHRINVPAAKMSLDTAAPDDFAAWLAERALPADDPDAFAAIGVFPQRGLFAAYVGDRLAPLLASRKVIHRRDRAAGVERRADGGFEVTLGEGDTLRADILVLATTHPLPAVPAPLAAVAASPRFLPDPYDPAALGRVGQGANVLVVGNGLTAADTVAALHRRGHRGALTTLSRHGLRSRGHAAIVQPAHGGLKGAPFASVRALVAAVRREIAAAQAAGLDWRPVLDALRNDGGTVWQELPVSERRRLVRHLRSFWDVHRFRIAPQVEAVLGDLEATGRLRNLAASLVAAASTANGVEVRYRRRRDGVVVAEAFDAIVNTTGPAHRGVVAAEPAASLHRAGLLVLDEVGLGLATSREGHAIGRNGWAAPNLFVAGPLARGTFGELMGLPEVTRYAEAVAARVAADVVELRASAGRLLQAG